MFCVYKSFKHHFTGKKIQENTKKIKKKSKRFQPSNKSSSNIRLMMVIGIIIFMSKINYGLTKS